MDGTQFFLLVLGVLAVAFLYSSVGHAGASGYIANEKPTMLGLSVRGMMQ